MKFQILFLITVLIVGVFGHNSQYDHYKKLQALGPKLQEQLLASFPGTVYSSSNCPDKSAICTYCRKLGPA